MASSLQRRVRADSVESLWRAASSSGETLPGCCSPRASQRFLSSMSCGDSKRRPEDWRVGRSLSAGRVVVEVEEDAEGADADGGAFVS